MLMKTLVTDGQGNLSIQELPIPTYTPYQALVRMISCGVCNGTDTKLIAGHFKNYHTYPAVLGHEGYAEVVAVGDRVRSFRVGDRVLLPFLEEVPPPYYSAWGAFSEYAVVGDAQACQAEGLPFSEGYLAQTVVPETPGLDDATAPMIVTFREVLAAIRRFDLRPDQQIIIYGMGPVGLSFVRMAKLLGVRTVIAVDIAAEKLDVARRMGADVTLNSTTDAVPEAVRALAPEGLDRAIDAVGINDLINQAMGLICDHGHICCYGISAHLGMPLDWTAAPYNLSLDFVQWPSKKEEGEAHAQVMRWIAEGQLSPGDFVSHVFAFDRVLDAFALALSRGTADVRKIVVTF
jgi:threonine dehydrogenase-like Zn-dependent dehydrogenase